MTRRLFGHGCMVAVLLLFGAIVSTSVANAQEHKTRNIIFVMTDGLRWQEVFQGADEALMNKQNGAVDDVATLKREYWRDTPEARREALLPFLWSVVGKNGQIYGNRKAGSEAYVTNGMNFSYPGYNETLCGFADPSIDSNNKIPNHNVTVLEWLHGMTQYRNRIAAFAAWDTFPFIFNADRAGFPVIAGFAPLKMSPSSPRLELLNRLKQEAYYFDGEPFDTFPFHSAVEYLKAQKPRVLYLSLGETDEWAHAGRYDLYLRAAHRVDQYLQEIWETVQSMPEYRGMTTLIVSVDHGRGEAPVEWKSHGQKIPDSKYMWMAFLGPDTRPLGERKNAAAVTQSQIAATLAALLGEDYNSSAPRAGKPIADVLPQSH